MFDVWLFLRLKNILPLGERVCLKVEVWLFDWVFCGTIAGNWSPISPLWHAGLLVWAWSRHCVGKFVFRCQYEQSRTRQNTKVALQFWNVWTELRHMQLSWLLDKDSFPQPGFTHVVHLDCAPNEKAFPEFSLKPPATTSFKTFQNESVNESAASGPNLLSARWH